MLEVKALTKKFGTFTALQDISLTVEDGSIYGLVGYNGAGKTTLLKNICGIYRPEGGEVLFDRENIFNNEAKKEEIFFMPDDLYFGAYDEKGGAVVNGVKFYDSSTCHHRPQVSGGHLEDECSDLLKKFFKNKRSKLK